MTVDSIYLNSQKYVADKPLGWTHYRYETYNTNQSEPTPSNTINLPYGTVKSGSVYWRATGPNTFAVSDPFQLNIGGQTKTLRLFSYYDVNNMPQMAMMTEQTFKIYYESKYTQI